MPVWKSTRDVLTWIEDLGVWVVRTGTRGPQIILSKLWIRLVVTTACSLSENPSSIPGRIICHCLILKLVLRSDGGHEVMFVGVL